MPKYKIAITNWRSLNNTVINEEFSVIAAFSKLEHARAFLEMVNAAEDNPVQAAPTEQLYYAPEPPI